ncbi:uncharacterized protein LOC131429767 [Malaya genurostris]|uniref:uncharacterized protein LOC131429767 n=1 Tax=Malaya genurostris TaxID=325434 RepID=UPI0026F3C5B6|nr:uncharacterized protein LOC131429767 [Malaya genurostris]XP_058450086.1 uncharacterized protein LOC131429767 [Malaya genurostris]XP_058450087.1 uncharacterized protein LOC131429767 [Malaya genurostris]
MVTRFERLMGCSSIPIGETPPEDETQCSGRGDCLNGTCLCEIRYSGDECSGFNLPYHASISSVFYFVAFISMVQLMICIIAEYQRLKQPSFLRACRLTTQKLLYFFVFIASVLRGAYFTTPAILQPAWVTYLMSAYYPLVMTCASLVVCLWAEIFHLRDIRWERSQFLSKSFLGFLAFNLLPYSLFLAEIAYSHLFSGRSTHFFNGCYAALLLIVVIFFLIYGVEVFFKVRGGFVYDFGAAPSSENVNASQLHQSRFGLLSQAIMLIVIIGFLTSETLGDFWKKKVPVYSRNWHDIVFRLAEIGVALWFPCCLWNSMAPEQLWILNPRKLLTRQIDPVSAGAGSSQEPEASTSTAEEGQSFLGKKDCWICYDNEKPEPLIQPCRCTGDVSSVHHECLRRWLVESCANSDTVLMCKVCESPYEIERSNRLDWEKGFTIQHWAKTIIIVTLMCITGAGAWVIIQLNEDSFVRVLVAGFAIIIGYILFKMLGENTVTAIERAKVSSINIVTSASDLNNSRNDVHTKLNTICQDVECK